MHEQTDTWTDRGTNIWPCRQTDAQTDRCTDRQTNGQTHTDRQMHRQTDTWTDRNADRHMPYHPIQMGEIFYAPFDTFHFTTFMKDNITK